MCRPLLPLVLLLACGLPATAQLKTTQIPTPGVKHRHLVGFKCEGQPDRVYSRRDERYFGCVNGKVACSDDGISQSMIATYERNRADILVAAQRRRLKSDARHASRRPGRSNPSSSTRSTSVRTIKSTPRPPAQTEPIEADKVRQVAIGTSIDEVISMLGQPKWRIAGTTEMWRYSLTSGESAKLMFEGGQLTSVVLP